MDEELRSNAGRAGFYLSIVPWITVVLLTILQPG
jgi:hypothetical protein